MKRRRLKLVLAAWAVGYCTYLLKEMLIVHDWGIALVALLMGWGPAILYSAFFVGVALLLGLFLKVKSIKRAWQDNPRFALWLLVGSIAALLVSPYVGLSQDLHMRDGGRVTMLNPFVWFTSYVLIIFVVAHWPEPKGRQTFNREGQH
jgi:hypothetical protein